MEWKRIGAWGGLVGLLCVTGVFAEQGQPAGDGSSASASSAVAAVPRLVKFSGAVRDTRGEPLNSVAVRLTFSVYEEPTGGAALWAESQVAQLDEQGHYTVLLGATRADGLPVELFPAGKARWLGVQVEGRDEEPRVLLVSVPYALKAEDAAMLGGRSAADFVLAEQLKDEVRTQVEAQKPTATNSIEMLIPGQPIRPAFTAGVSTFTCTTSGDCLAATQNGAGRALSAAATSSTESVLVQQNGTGYGLRALALSNTALHGQVTGASGTTYGVRGLTPSTTGAGVLGSSTAATGLAFGVRGNAVSTGGGGLGGFNTAATGLAYGIYGQTSSTEGTALYARALAGTGGTIGLWGDANSTSGTAIVGRAIATSGTTTGIYTEVQSAAGTALIVDNIAGGKLLSAWVNGTEKFGVNGSGDVSASGSVTATSFAGSGSALTALSATSLASGTVPSARISGTYSNAVTFNNASNVFVGNGSGLTNVPGGGGVATDLNCVGCVASSEVSFNYAGSSSQGGVATSALSADAAITAATATNTLSLGGVAAANYARTDTANTFNGNQTILGGNLALPADGLVAGTNQLALYGGTNVGVGTSTGSWIAGRPTLYITGPTNPNLTIDQTSNGIARWTIFTHASNGDLLIYNSTGGIGSERFHISTAGDVGIGVLSPLDKLHVAGDIRVGTGATGCVKDADATVIAGTCSSDVRLKTNIQPFAPLLDKLVRLTPVHFSWRSTEHPEFHFGTAPSFGLIAQDVEQVFPELVTQDSQGWKAVKYNQLPFLMLQGIRELKAENDSLREQMKSQQAQMSALAAELAEAKQILQLVQAQLLPARRVVERAGGSGPASPVAGGGNSR
jgi:hypothetical protein